MPGTLTKEQTGEIAVLVVRHLMYGMSPRHELIGLIASAAGASNDEVTQFFAQILPKPKKEGVDDQQQEYGGDLDDALMASNRIRGKN